MWRGRVQDTLDAAGRPPLGGMADWEVFPFERDGLTPKPIGERVVPEPVARASAGRLRHLPGAGRDDLVLHTGDAAGGHPARWHAA